MIAYAFRHLAGAWDVMNGRPAGLDKLDLTVEGFWRSFAVFIPAIPLDAVALLADRAVMATEGRTVPPMGLEEYALHLLVWLLAWAAVVGLFAVLARALGLTDRFVPLIVALNWSSLLIAAIAIVPFVLFLVGLLPLAAFEWAAIGIGILVLAFVYLLVRTALAVRAVYAIAVLLMGLLVEVPIMSLLDPTW